jgi:hypothetical protein
MLLFSLPLGVVTVTGPVVAPTGTLVVISELDKILNLAGMPLKLTAVALAKFVPRIVTFVPDQTGLLYQAEC